MDHRWSECFGVTNWAASRESSAHSSDWRFHLISDDCFVPSVASVLMDMEIDCVVRTNKWRMIYDIPRHVRMLIAEWPHIGIGVNRRMYAVPLKYASRGSFDELPNIGVGKHAVREKEKKKMKRNNYYQFDVLMKNNAKKAAIVW